MTEMDGKLSSDTSGQAPRNIHTSGHMFSLVRVSPSWMLWGAERTTCPHNTQPNPGGRRLPRAEALTHPPALAA